MSNGDCLVSQAVSSSNSDVYCVKWNGASCTTCASGFFLSQTGKCQQADPLCKTLNQVTGICVECYQGYVLSSNSCVIPVIVQIPFCQTTSAAGTCVECIDNYYLKTSNSCTPVSILCGGKYNKVTGQCTGCTEGYFLQGGECIYPAMGIDPACEKYSAGGFCDKCSLGFYLLSFKCTQIDNYCTKFEYTTSTCTECYNKKPQGAGCV